MHLALTKFASIGAPFASAENTNGALATNTIRRPTSTTNTSEALDSDTLNDTRVVVHWAGHYVTVKNEDLVNPVEFAYSAAPVTLVYGATGTFTAGNAQSGWRLGPGESLSEMVPLGSTHANWIQPAGAAASTIAFRPSEIAVVK